MRIWTVMQMHSIAFNGQYSYFLYDSNMEGWELQWEMWCNFAIRARAQNESIFSLFFPFQSVPSFMHCVDGEKNGSKCWTHQMWVNECIVCAHRQHMLIGLWHAPCIAFCFCFVFVFISVFQIYNCHAVVWRWPMSSTNGICCVCTLTALYIESKW